MVGNYQETVFLDRAGHVHTWAYSDCDRMHKACANSSQTKSQRREVRWAKVPLLDIEILAIDDC